MTTTQEKVAAAAKAKAATKAAPKTETTAAEGGEKKKRSGGVRRPADQVLEGLYARRKATVEKYEAKLSAIDEHIAKVKTQKAVMTKEEAAAQLKAAGLGVGDDAKAKIAAEIKRLQALAKQAGNVTEDDLAALDASDDTTEADEVAAE